MGAEVDKVANHGIFHQLREEAGLKVRAGLRVRYFDEDFGLEIDGISQEGSVRPGRPVYRDGNRVFVIDPDTEKAVAIAEGMTRGASGRGEDVRFSEPYRAGEQEVIVVVGESGSDLEEFNVLAIREGAKMALGYIARVTSESLATHPAFEPLRDCALRGKPVPGAWLDRFWSDIVWLPRSQQVSFLRLAGGSEKAPSEADLRRVIEEAQSTGQPPIGVKQIDTIGHRLSLVKDENRKRFEVALFSRLGIAIPLANDAPDLPIRTDWWMFTPRKSGTIFG